MASNSVCLSDCLYVTAEGKLAVRVDNSTIKCVDDGSGGGMLQAVSVSQGSGNNIILNPEGGLEDTQDGLGIKLNPFTGCNDLDLGSDGLLMRYDTNQFSSKSSKIDWFDNQIQNPSPTTNIIPPELDTSIQFTTPGCNSSVIVFAIATFGSIHWSFVDDNEPTWTDFFEMRVNNILIERESRWTNIDSRGISGAYYQGSNANMVAVISRVVPASSTVNLKTYSAFSTNVGGQGMNLIGSPNRLAHEANKINVITVLDNQP